METWVEHFFDTVSGWWPEPAVRPVDRNRVALLEQVAGAAPKLVLELGSGSGATAVATASAGYSVLGVEFSGVRVAQAQKLAAACGSAAGGGFPPPAFLKADFHTVDLPSRFDVVACWNGFGVGSDADQRRLLRRIAANWLVPGGYLIMDVYAPWRWSRLAGDRAEVGDLVCENSFDTVRSRFVETWWRQADPQRSVTQYGRCYSPADYLLLIEGTGLSLVEFRLNGELIEADDAAGAHSALLDAWEYTAITRRDDARGRA